MTQNPELIENSHISNYVAKLKNTGDMSTLLSKQRKKPFINSMYFDSHPLLNMRNWFHTKRVILTENLGRESDLYALLEMKQ